MKLPTPSCNWNRGGGGGGGGWGVGRVEYSVNFCMEVCTCKWDWNPLVPHTRPCSAEICKPIQD